MAKIKDRSKPSIPPVAPGTYTAICVHAIEIGEQLTTFQGSKSYKNQELYTFELVGEFVEIDGEKKPRTLSKRFNIPKSEKTENSGLRKFVESWQGRKFANDEWADFDMNDLVGRECMIGVVLNDSGEYANIDTVMGLPKGMSAGTPQSELIRFDIDPWNQETFEKLPDWAQEIIKKSTQYQKEHAPATTVAVTPQAAQEECPI